MTIITTNLLLSVNMRTTWTFNCHRPLKCSVNRNIERGMMRMYKAIITTRDNNGIHKERIYGNLMTVLTVVENYALLKKYVLITHITIEKTKG